MYEIWAVGIEERGSEWLSTNPLVVNSTLNILKKAKIITLLIPIKLADTDPPY